MIAILSLAVKDLLKRWKLLIVLAGLLGISLANFLALFSYQKSATNIYEQLETNWLVVGSSDGLSEVHGSRMTSAVKDMLIQKGYSDPIPEIHQFVGTSYTNGILMRAFQLEDYRKISTFTLLSGRALEEGDPARLVMVGETLARTKNAQVGSDLLLRGRKFRVIGIFITGSFQDNEAWISLKDAQDLLNYGNDVSLYLIPDNGSLQPGDLLEEGISVTQKGETTGAFGPSVFSFFNFLGIMGVLGYIATAITLANLLWRLAYLHQHEFGILKSLGFGFQPILLYFITQASVIIFWGIIFGLMVSTFLLFPMIQDFSAFGVGLARDLDTMALGIMALITCGLLAIGVIIPLVSIHRTSIPDLIGRN
ncbi:MAG: ABC transporter permease [Chloroflexota bacterium]